MRVRGYVGGIAVSLFGVAGSLWAAENPKITDSAPNMVTGGAAEFLYIQPTYSNNQRFAGLQATHFEDGTFSSRQIVLRGRGDVGDKAGLDGRVGGELTYLTADAKQSYETGRLKLKHRYAGFDLMVGGTYYLSPLVSLYAEAAILFPGFKNETSISSGAGKVVYESDKSDGGFFTSGMAVGVGCGVDVKLRDAWFLKLHADDWPMGSGKVGGIQVGAGYAI